MAFQYFIILFPIAFSVQTNSELLLQDKECARRDFFDEEATGEVKMNICIIKLYIWIISKNHLYILGQQSLFETTRNSENICVFG
jgi:hypothetical protein